MMLQQTTSGPRPSDKWIPWYLVLFFLFMFAALIPMAYLAVHTMPGLVSDTAYDEGVAYNKAIAAAAQEKALGWLGEIDFTATPDAVQGQTVYVLKDAQGKPIDNADVHVWLVRPTKSGMDKDAEMKSRGLGRYEANLPLLAHGLWDVRVSATRNGENFQTEKRIVVP